MKDCNQCGKCCTRYGNGGLSASENDIQMWDLFRPDIHDYVNNGKIWMNPETGEQMDHCPWLRQVPGEQKFTCDIYHDRPEDCRFYPVTIRNMIDDECEMLEPADLENLKKAQTKLDIIMSDSRPPVES